MVSHREQALIERCKSGDRSALEVLIVSDLLHSIVARTLEEMVILAITVLTRIALSFILARELEELKQST